MWKHLQLQQHIGKETLQFGKFKSATAHSGTNIWAMLPTTGSYNYLTLASDINLSSTPNPYLSFWIRKADGGTGALSIEASNNSGTTWTVLAQPSFSGANICAISSLTK